MRRGSTRRTISCYSFSKSLSIPGERIGYVAVNPESGVSAMLVNMCGPDFARHRPQLPVLGHPVGGGGLLRPDQRPLRV